MSGKWKVLEVCYTNEWKIARYEDETQQMLSKELQL